MAVRCKGTSCPYGYGHHQEHSDAAKLGWERRRHGEARYIEKAFRGYKLHSHAGSFGSYAHYILQEEGTGETFELSRDEYKSLVNEFRAAERSQVIQEELFSRETRAKQRAADAANRQREGERRRHEREQERARRQREKEDEYDRRRAARFERDSLYEQLREYVPGGIKRYKGGHEDEEFRAVPRSFRARGGDGLTLDDAALQLRESAPWLGIESADDLTQAFARAQMNLANERYRRKVAA